MSQLTLTATQLRLLAMCERRVWLDKYGNREDRVDVSSVTAIPFTTDIQHDEHIHTTTRDGMREIKVASWEEAVEVTRLAMEQGCNVIGACLETVAEIAGSRVRLIGRIDHLKRLPDGTYYPIEVTHGTTLNQTDHLQLDFYCFLVGSSQDRVPDGEFWIGAEANNRPVQIVPHCFDSQRFQQSLLTWITVIRHHDEPDILYRSHCRPCHWHSLCVDALKQQRSVQLLHSIRRDTVQALADRDVHTVDQLALLSVDELRQIKGIKKTAQRYLAQAKAYVQAAPVWYQALPDVLHQGGIMLDLETMVDEDGSIWSLGWCDTNGDTQVAVVHPDYKQTTTTVIEKLTLHIVPHSDDAWRVLRDSIAELELPIYHWTGFDAEVMAQTAPTDVQQALLPRMHDLYKTFTGTVQLPVRSYSIKTVAAYFGFQWRGYAAWDAAYNDYKLWRTRGTQAALQRACDYQCDDVLALVEVWHWMVETAP